MAKKIEKPWKCQECGRKFTVKGAAKAMFSAQGCPKCGSADIDLDVKL